MKDLLDKHKHFWFLCLTIIFVCIGFFALPSINHSAIALVDEIQPKDYLSKSILNLAMLHSSGLKAFMENTSARNWIAAISLVVSVITATRTYQNAECWKRRQYIESKVDEFESQIETLNVRKMMSFELQCIELFPFLDKPTYRFVIVEDCLWTEAILECKCNKTLKNEYEKIDKDEPLHKQKAAIKAVIRDNFNMFLYYLQQFEKMIEAGAIDKKNLEAYINPWLDYIANVNANVIVKCPASNENYSSKEALLEYLGILESIPKENLSIVQRDVRKLVKHYRKLESFMQNIEDKK